MIMEVVCGSTVVEPPMSPRSPPGGGLDLHGKGDRWLKFRFWRERLACFRAFLFKGFLSDEECDCVTTLLICFVPIFCAFVALVVACIVYKYKTGVRVVCHFAHYARAASAAAAACEKGLVETVVNVWDFHASAMLAAASSLRVSCLIVSLFNDLEQIVYINLP
ncbi:hypothetical protein EZV62_006948 [Acer yangbiense]|uniref:Uncharacterized protein n=1 Tax=Acer yangbiense TaxID=1000413 RepID=A0A5C7I7X0_9ROSI|nr:hypothetical protein EZV62_006948 [Acer yangbiense]